MKLGSAVYMCPVLILHYILDHKYLPPQEFITATVQGAFLTSNDFVACPETSVDEWLRRRPGRQ